MKRPDRRRVAIRMEIARRRRIAQLPKRSVHREAKRERMFRAQTDIRRLTLQDPRTHRRIVVAPVIIDLRDNRTSTILFLRTFLKAALIARFPVLLDFRQTKHVSALALALVLAVVHRCLRLEGAQGLVEGTHPIDAAVRRQFQRSGFYDLLGIANPERHVKPRYPREYIPFESARASLGEKAENFRNALLGPRIKLSLTAGTNLYRGVTEAFNNAISHAYPIERNFRPNVRGRWWLFGHFDRRTKNLNVFVVDLGVGIPRTIKRRIKGPFVAFLSSVGVTSSDDGSLIQAATRLGVTQTGEQKRGKGLPDLKKIIDIAKGGRLRILSNRGEYSYTFGEGEASRSYSDSIEATLVHWRIPLASISDWQGDSDEQPED